MIFYFSGSGNSYVVAKQIADKIEGEQVVPLARFKDFKQCANAQIKNYYTCRYVIHKEISL